MGYDISLVRGKSKAKLSAKMKDIPLGGQFAISDQNRDVQDDDLNFYITYNYAWYLYQTIDKKDGVRFIYGKKAKDVLPVLEAALPKLDRMIRKEQKTGKVLSQTWGKGNDYDDNSTDYWAISAKNAKKAVEGLIALAKLAPFFTFDGD